jgi:hypothetical protein
LSRPAAAGHGLAQGVRIGATAIDKTLAVNEPEGPVGNSGLVSGMANAVDRRVSRYMTLVSG